jgi:hypothetical protein
VADDNKIQLDLEISDRSIAASWDLVDERAQKSAQDSAAVFEEASKKQESALLKSIERVTGVSRELARKGAAEAMDALSSKEAAAKSAEIFQLRFKQNLDNSIKQLTGADRVKKSAAESASVFEDAFRKEAAAWAPVPIDVGAASGAGGFQAIKSLADVNAAVLLARQGVALLQKAFSDTLNFVLEGEKIQKIETRFKALSTQVGIASESFSVDMKKALNGFVDDTDALEFASQAFVKLGSSAKALPQVIEASRKAYQVFGGDILTNAGKIINAAETGSSRTLRDIGLYINLDNVLKKYAKSLGTVPALLTDTQKEQARLNAILAEADTRFAGVQQKAGATSAYTQLKVAMKDLQDEFAKIANSSLGKTFQGLAEGAKKVVDTISEGLRKSRPAETVAEMTERIEALRAKQSKYSTELASQGVGAATSYTAALRGQLIGIKDQIANYEELRRKTSQLASEQLAAGKRGQPADTSADEAKLRARQAATDKLNELNKAQLQSEIVLSQDRLALSNTQANLEQLYGEQKKQALNNFNLEYSALQKTFDENGAFTAEQKNVAVETLENTHLNNMLKLRGDYKNRLKLITNEEAYDIQGLGDVFSSVLEGIKNSALFQFTSIKGSLKDLGKAFVTTFKQQATNAIFAFAQGSKNAEEAANGLFTGILNAMGEMLISQGLGFIIQGAAYTYAGMPNGPALAAAGAGMIAVGATMAAISAANGGKVGATSGAGGGATGADTGSSFNNSNPTTPIVDMKPENPNTTINVNVDKVFDRKETGMWITDILQDNFEQNGIIVRSNV